MAEVIQHPDYSRTDSGKVVNDIMLLKLSSPVLYSRWVAPVCLPDP